MEWKDVFRKNATDCFTVFFLFSFTFELSMPLASSVFGVGEFFFMEIETEANTTDVLINKNTLITDTDISHLCSNSVCLGYILYVSYVYHLQCLQIYRFEWFLRSDAYYMILCAHICRSLKIMICSSYDAIVYMCAAVKFFFIFVSMSLVLFRQRLEIDFLNCLGFVRLKKKQLQQFRSFRNPKESIWYILQKTVSEIVSFWIHWICIVAQLANYPTTLYV